MSVCLSIIYNKTFIGKLSRLNYQCNFQWQFFLVFPRIFWEKAMVPHSSTVAQKIPWMEEPGGLQSMGNWEWTWLSDFTFTFHFHALEKAMAPHSSVLAWRISWTEEPMVLQSIRLQGVGHKWSNFSCTHATAIPFLGIYPEKMKTLIQKDNAPPMFLEHSQDV